MNKAGSECWLRKLQSSWLPNKSRHGTLCHSAFTEFNLEQLIYLLWTGGLYKEFLGQDLWWVLSCSEQKSNRSLAGLSHVPWAAPPSWWARSSLSKTQDPHQKDYLFSTVWWFQELPKFPAQVLTLPSLRLLASFTYPDQKLWMQNASIHEHSNKQWEWTWHTEPSWDRRHKTSVWALQESNKWKTKHQCDPRADYSWVFFNYNKVL